MIISPEVTPAILLNITYKKEKIESLYSTRYRLINSGRKPIESSDVLEPISLEFSEFCFLFMLVYFKCIHRFIKTDLIIILCNLHITNHSIETKTVGYFRYAHYSRHNLFTRYRTNVLNLTKE